jgi:hypothetical protein
MCSEEILGLVPFKHQEMLEFEKMDMQLFITRVASTIPIVMAYFVSCKRDSVCYPANIPRNGGHIMHKIIKLNRFIG